LGAEAVAGRVAVLKIWAVERVPGRGDPAARAALRGAVRTGTVEAAIRSRSSGQGANSGAIDYEVGCRDPKLRVQHGVPLADDVRRVLILGVASM